MVDAYNRSFISQSKIGQNGKLSAVTRRVGLAKLLNNRGQCSNSTPGIF